MFYLQGIATAGRCPMRRKQMLSTDTISRVQTNVAQARGRTWHQPDVVAACLDFMRRHVLSSFTLA